MTLVFGHDKAVADWASRKFGYPMENWIFSVGIIDRSGVLTGAAIFHNHNGTSVELSFYGPGSVTKGVVLGLMGWIFERLPVSRVTAMTQRGNKRVVTGLPKIGFKFEGIARRYYGETKRLDGVMFGLTRAEALNFLERRAAK